MVFFFFNFKNTTYSRHKEEVPPSKFLNHIARALKSAPCSPTPPLFHMTSHLMLHAKGYTHPQIYPFLSFLTSLFILLKEQGKEVSPLAGQVFQIHRLRGQKGSLWQSSLAFCIKDSLKLTLVLSCNWLRQILHQCFSRYSIQMVGYSFSC